MHMKKASQLESGDRMKVHSHGLPSIGTVVLAFRSTDKADKVQHMGTGNVTRGIHVVYDDAAESLLHPDELVEIVE